MMSFKDNFFFVKFSVLFFIVTIFGYWGIDLNSEELYIAFSFFFLVVVGFIAVRTSTLLFFVNTVNRKYARLLVDLNRIRLILRLRNDSLNGILSTMSVRKARLVSFMNFSREFLPLLISLKSKIFLLNSNRFFASLAVNVNFFVLNTARYRRFSGFFENSARFFSVTI